MLTMREADREAHKSLRDQALDLEYEQVMGMSLGVMVLFPALVLGGSFCFGWYPLKTAWISMAALFLWEALGVLVIHMIKQYYDLCLDVRMYQQVRLEQEWKAIHAPQVSDISCSESVS
jgi:hypothetical protein